MTQRIEKDSMGELPVPADRLYGAQTARAVINFPVSGRPIGRDLVQALGWIKGAAAEVNRDLGKLPAELADAIVAAAAEVAEGALDDHFPVDVFQTGSGTSSIGASGCAGARGTFPVRMARRRPCHAPSSLRRSWALINR